MYLRNEASLFGHSGAREVELTTGTHKYPFSFLIPPSAAASFEVIYGSCSYYIEAILEDSLGFKYNCKRHFTVSRNDDLNNLPELKLPVQCEEIKSFCCLFCESEPIVMTFSLPCSGFVPGQDVPITISYANKSNVAFERTTVKLRRITEYKR